MFWKKSKKENILKEPKLLKILLDSLTTHELETDKLWCIEFNNKNSISSVNFKILDILYHFDGDETSFVTIIPTLKALNVIYDYLIKYKFINTNDEFSFDNFEKYTETTNVENFEEYSIYTYKVNDKEFKFRLRFYKDEEIVDEFGFPGLLLFVELIERS